MYTGSKLWLWLWLAADITSFQLWSLTVCGTCAVAPVVILHSQEQRHSQSLDVQQLQLYFLNECGSSLL